MNPTKLNDETTAAAATTPSQDDFFPSMTWNGPKLGYYFGTSDQGTGYYRDWNQTTMTKVAAAASSSSVTDENDKKRHRKRITIDESQNKIRAIPSRHASSSSPTMLSAEELLRQAEEEHANDKVLELTDRGIQSAVHRLEQLFRTNALQRAQATMNSTSSNDAMDTTGATATICSSSDNDTVDARVYLESELALYEQVQAFSGVATHPQLFHYLLPSNNNTRTNHGGAAHPKHGGNGRRGGLELCAELLSHPNTDIATSLIHVWMEWLDPANAAAANETNNNNNSNPEEEELKNIQAITQFGKQIINGQNYNDDEQQDSSLLELLIGNLGRLDTATISNDNDTGGDDDDDVDVQGIQDILKCVEHLIELLPELATKTIAQRTTLVSWLLQQLQTKQEQPLPKQQNRDEIEEFMGRCAELLALLVQQPSLHTFITDWTQLPVYKSILVEDDDETENTKQGNNPSATMKQQPKVVDGLEIMLQTIAPFRKRQPSNANEADLLENIILIMASILVFTADIQPNNSNHTFLSQFLQAQGPELVVRALRERVHAGGMGLVLLDLRNKDACDHLVGTVGVLKYLFPVFMGRSIPKPAEITIASSSSKRNKSKRSWLLKLEEHIIHIFYNFTRFLDDTSPHDAKQRFLVKFLDHDKLDRLVELLLYYDDKARKAEYKFYLQAEDDTDDTMMATAALSAKLAGGGDLFHRLGAICAFVCVHSKRSHKHILEQLTLQQSGIGLVKTALVEFISLLVADDVDNEPSKQRKQLQAYLQQL